MNVEAVAIVAGILFVGLAMFHVALALGLPAGHLAYGGRFAKPDNTLPTAWRILSAAAVVILGVFAWVILARAGVIATSIDSKYLTVWSWMVVAYLAINTAANFASQSKVERFGLGGVSLVLVVLCSIVAAAGPA